MIRLLSNNLFVALSFSALVLSFYFLTNGDLSLVGVIRTVLLFLMAVGLNFLCRRFRIIGMKSHFTMVIFSVLMTLVFPVLSIKALVVGAMWLMAVYYSFLSWEQPERSRHYLIYIGTLLGLAQLLDAYSVLLFIPFFVLFYQNAVLNIAYYLLSIMYFIMVLLVYLSILFVTDNMDIAFDLIPMALIDYSIYQIPTVSFMLPSFLLLVGLHFLSLRSYRFRYPNRSIKINTLFALQMLIAAVLLLLSSAPGLFIMLCLPLAILLAVGFSFRGDQLLSNALFMAFLLMSMLSSFGLNMLKL